MKKLVKVEEIEGAGLTALLGEKVTLYCANYIYAGVLTGVNETCVELTGAAIVYETGPFTGKAFKDAQLLNAGGVWYVQTGAIESFGVHSLVL